MAIRICSVAIEITGANALYIVELIATDRKYSKRTQNKWVYYNSILFHGSRQIFQLFVKHDLKRVLKHRDRNLNPL
jgi:hypothetical protein